MVAGHTSFTSESPVRVWAILMMGSAAEADKNRFRIDLVEVSFYRRYFLHHVPVLISFFKSLLFIQSPYILRGHLSSNTKKDHEALSKIICWTVSDCV